MDKKPFLLDKTVEDFMTTFYGYGEPKGGYWFVGKEEGDSGSINENISRILQWKRRGKKAFEDFKRFSPSN